MEHTCYSDRNRGAGEFEQFVEIVDEVLVAGDEPLLNRMKSRLVEAGELVERLKHAHSLLFHAERVPQIFGIEGTVTCIRVMRMPASSAARSTTASKSNLPEP